MRCAICDATLNPSEIAYNHDHDEFEPCGTCLEAIANVFEDHLDECMTHFERYTSGGGPADDLSVVPRWILAC